MRLPEEPLPPRIYMILVGMGLSAIAPAQAELLTASAALRAIARANPTNLQGNNPLQPQDRSQPIPKKPAFGENPAKGFRVKRAGKQRFRGSEVELSEGVIVETKGYVLQGDQLIGDIKTQIFTLVGNVKITGPEIELVGDQATVDLDRETYEARGVKTAIDPTLVQGSLKDKLYARGGQSFGSRLETNSLDCSVTTCNLDHPHFEIDARRNVVRPGKRAIFYDADIKLLGATLLRVPYLSIPLDDRSYKYLPQVGQTVDEGYFIKERFGVPLRSQDETLDTRLEYMSKLGTGFGADYGYRGKKFGGLTKVYAISGQSDTFTLTNQHRQNFSFGSLQIDSDFQRNNYLAAPGSQTVNTRATLEIPQGRSDRTALTFQRNNSESTGFETTSQTLGLADQRRIGDYKSNLDLNLLANGSSGSGFAGGTRRQLDVRYRGEQDVSFAMAGIEYQRSIPIGETANAFASNDRTPVLSLRSDSKRLFGQGLDKTFPFRTELSFGEFRDPSAQDALGRTMFSFGFNRRDGGKGRLTADTTGEFRQTFYSDETAQYILNLGTNTRYDLGNRTGINLRYSYLRPYGFSPLGIDRTGRNNFASLDMNFRPTPTLLVGAQTGYDLLRLEEREVAWQQLGVRTEYRPNQALTVRGLYTYDTTREVWSNARLDLTYNRGGTLVSFGTRYDGLRHTWSNANLFVDNLKLGRARIGAALQYNGFLKRFESRQWNAIYDLHCAEAVLTIQENLTGFRAGRQVFFMIRLKAFPFDLPFGVGTRGQPIGSGTGRDF